jgi:hypothetical protein
MLGWKEGIVSLSMAFSIASLEPEVGPTVDVNGSVAGFSVDAMHA